MAKSKASIGPLDFLRQAYAELKKAKWPTRKEAIRLTMVVIIVSVFVGAYIAACDFLLTRAVTLLVSLK